MPSHLRPARRTHLFTFSRLVNKLMTRSTSLSDLAPDIPSRLWLCLSTSEISSERHPKHCLASPLAFGATRTTPDLYIHSSPRLKPTHFRINAFHRMMSFCRHTPPLLHASSSCQHLHTHHCTQLEAPKQSWTTETTICDHAHLRLLLRLQLCLAPNDTNQNS